MKKAALNGRGGPMCPPVRRADTQVGPYIGDDNNAVKMIGHDREIVGFDCVKFVVQFKPPTFNRAPGVV